MAGLPMHNCSGCHGAGKIAQNNMNLTCPQCWGFGKLTPTGQPAQSITQPTQFHEEVKQIPPQMPQYPQNQMVNNPIYPRQGQVQQPVIHSQQQPAQCNQSGQFIQPPIMPSYPMPQYQDQFIQPESTKTASINFPNPLDGDPTQELIDQALIENPEVDYMLLHAIVKDVINKYLTAKNQPKEPESESEENDASQGRSAGQKVSQKNAQTPRKKGGRKAKEKITL